MITIFGAGYVGFSLAILLSRRTQVCLVDINEEKITQINNGIAPIIEPDINKYLQQSLKLKRLTARKFSVDVVRNSKYIVIALPTNFDIESKSFDTSVLTSQLEKIAEVDPTIPIVIKSTVPVGYTDRIQNDLNLSNCFFSPEFLREGKAVHDNLNPSRIVVGSNSISAVDFVRLLESAANKRNIPVVFTDNKTAEMAKLASNTYLAMRVAFFNEIDNYSLIENLNSDDLITSISADPRIGDGYNNPSFGYGGYCLPKDVQQTVASFENIREPAPLLSAIQQSNETRLERIANEILAKDVKTIGLYRLQMKHGSDNLRESTSVKLLRKLIHETDKEILVYEPHILLEGDLKEFQETNFETFVDRSQLIIANRLADELIPHMAKVFSRDVYNEN